MSGLSSPSFIKGVSAAVALSVLLSGCATVPKLGTAPVPRTPASYASAQGLAGTSGDWPDAAWWHSFGDPGLDTLITEALAGSPDAAVAAARARAADAIAAQAGAARSPSLTLDGSISGQKLSENLGFPAVFVPKGILDAGRVAGTLRFDPDLWGRDRAALAAATSEAQAAHVDEAQAQLILTTSIAATYATLAQYYAQRDAAVEALATRATTAQLTASRVASGLDTRGELRQAEARVPAARADIAALDEAIALTRNALAALVGAGPDQGLQIARPHLVAPIGGVPDSLTLALVGRRPDVVAARLRAEAAADRIKVARANFYPNIDLTAVAGLNALGLGQLVKSGSTFGNAGAALTLPIFDGGRLAGQYRGARADYDGAVARYDGVLVGALHDVADALTSLRALGKRLSEERRALSAAADASKIARLRYLGGLSSQLPVLATDDVLLGNRRVVADLEARRVALNIALIRALGGGFQSKPDQNAAGVNLGR
jgi:NodT family efflux transporter outer membrane factor (OMF) lipoprotein